MTSPLQLFTPPTVTLPSARDWFFDLCLRNLPRELEDVVTWADKNYRVVTKDSEYFDSKRSPQLLEPLRMADDPLVSTVTLVKPIQTGGTSLGEILLFRWFLSGNGLIHYNWPTNDKATKRWKEFFEQRLKACHAVRAILPPDYADGFIIFPGITFSMHGVFTSGNLDSDTVDYVINEEVHQWEPGMLGKARGRQTRITFPKFITISNGGFRGDQLHQEFDDGTQQHYQAKCPGCSNPYHEANTVYHIMRIRWEDAHPELGGLRYDSEGCKRADGTFDYNKLIPTIRFQFPCGYPMPDDPRERRAAAAGGRYSEPFNTGAQLTNRSYTYQAVCCSDIRWLDLIKRKHLALRQLRAGTDAEWRLYLQECEALFYDADLHRPLSGTIEIASSLTKNRDGMKNRALRLAIGDWQQGYKKLGELTHWWLLILDVDEACNQQVVFEGKISSDAELLLELDAHEVPRSACFLDCSKNTKAIQSLCYREGLNAVSGIESHMGSFLHPDGSRRYYTLPKPIYKELNVPPRSNQQVRMIRRSAAVSQTSRSTQAIEYPPDEPIIIGYNKAGLIKNSFFIMEMKANVLANNSKATPADYITLTIPGDVSEDFKRHMESWIRVPLTKRNSKDQLEGFARISDKAPDHLRMCLAYAHMVLDNSGLLGDQLARLGLQPNVLPSVPAAEQTTVDA